MERPSKRLRIQDPDISSPRDSSSRLTEGLFTSGMGIRSDDTDRPSALPPTPTIPLNDLQRRAIFGPQDDMGHGLMRRAEATVTVAAPEIVVNINDGTTTRAAATIAPITTDTTLSLSELGTVTIPANLTSLPTTVLASRTTDSITLPPSSISSGTPSSTITGISSTSFSGASNGTSSSGNTVTVTTTTTIEVPFLNGTVFPPLLVTVTAAGDEQSPLSQSNSNPSASASGIVVEDDGPSASTLSFDGGSGAGPVTATSEAPAATSSESSGSGGGSSALTPQQQTVVGGVVGGIAGVAVVLVLVLFVLRRYRQKLKDQGRLPEQLAQGDYDEDGHGMSQRSSAIPLTTTLAASLRKLRPNSSYTQATDLTVSTAPDGERGFQRIAGRKIAPVLSSGGDGYGGDYGVFAKESSAGPSGHQRNERSLAGSSFYRDSSGFYGGQGPESPTFSSSPMIESEDKTGPTQARDFAAAGPRTSSQVSVVSSRPEISAALRPSPARTPVTVSPSPSSIRLPIQQSPSLGDAPPMPTFNPRLQVPDGVGRTLSSQDGSRISARSGRSRFAENV
jgi:hypothetical protein